MTKIIQFPSAERTHVDVEQEYALRAVRNYFDCVHSNNPVAVEGIALHRDDYFLAWLWERGFKVVPHEDV